MFELICGIALGAAFSPYWINAWDFIKPKLVELFEKITK